MKQLFANNATTTLSGSLSQGGTTMICASGEGANFPAPTGGDWCLLTVFEKDLSSNETRIEIVKCTGRTADTLTIERDYEEMTGETGGYAYPSSPGTTVYIQLRWTAAGAVNMIQEGDSRLTNARTPTGGAGGVLSGSYPNPGFAVDMATQSELNAVAGAKQDTLISGTNIKTVNSQSLLGSGNLEIQSGVGIALSGDTTIYVNQNKTFTVTNYNIFSTYSVSVTAGSASIVGDQVSVTAPATAQNITLTVTMDGNSTNFALTVQAAGVATPTITSPSNGATGVMPDAQITTSAFAAFGLADTHLNSDWEVWSGTGGTGTLLASSMADTSNKTSWALPGLALNTQHYLRVRHRGVNLGASAWAEVGFVTVNASITTPTITSPINNAVDVLPTATVTTSAFAWVGVSDTHLNTDWEVWSQAGGNGSLLASSMADTTNKTSWALPGLALNTAHHLRVRHRGAILGASGWAEVAFTTINAGVATPTNSTPSNGATNQNGSVTLTASAFSWVGLEDTHASSDWQVATDAGFTGLVVNVTGDTSNKTSYTATGLSVSQTYYWRVRYTGTANGTSGWSSAFSFTTAATFGGLIGTQGGQGFGVGVYPTTLPSGFSNMSSNTDPAHANYGNYQYTDGSVLVFVPRFYYRFGNAGSPRYATYGANALDIVGIDTYATEALANAAGYAMHRAFKDGGEDKSGFFIDKYLASKDGTTSCKSVANGVPISLTTTTTYTRSDGMTGCTGILADAVVLSRARGAGTFNTASVFMYSALALLSLAHAQASTTTTYCAWYDATHNFPKGCNNNALADTNDAGVTFTTAGDSGSANKPLTGSGSPFARTTHNGQSCGVADVNGAMWQVALGVTQPGTSGTDTTQRTTGTEYQRAWVLKTSVALSSLTSGWNGTNDAWGDTTNLNTKYDEISDLFWWTASGTTYFGSGSNQVFSGATSGRDWMRTAIGTALASTGMDTTGTSQFGNDYHYAYSRANLFVLCAGSWSNAANAGVFCRSWVIIRSSASSDFGFRACAYGS